MWRTQTWRALISSDERNDFCSAGHDDLATAAALSLQMVGHGRPCFRRVSALPTFLHSDLTRFVFLGATVPRAAPLAIVLGTVPDPGHVVGPVLVAQSCAAAHHRL